MNTQSTFPELPDQLFVSGTDTDAGKSYATGWLARCGAQNGYTVITQKLIQTGNQTWSEDIDVHRKVMGIEMQPRDLDHTTAPLILSYPASPHLAAKIDRTALDFSIASRSTEILSKEFDKVIIEGAGGLMVPLTPTYLTIQYIADHNLPVALVTNGKLGSINHTLLALSALRQYGIPLFALVYNPYFDADPIICADTVEYLNDLIATDYPGSHFLMMPESIMD